MVPAPIPAYLLPRGLPTAQTLRTLQQTRQHARRCFSATSAVAAKAKTTDKSRILAQPDKFRPPSHPQRIVNPRTTPTGQPVNYGPRLTAEQREAQNRKQYPNMFPPEGTVMFKFLTSRWIHVWIAMSILTTLATFTFTTNFKASSPFAHLLPAWSDLLVHPIDTVSQALHVYRMHVQHESVRVREQRHRRIEDAEKRRQYRVAHGLEEPSKEDVEAAAAAADEQAPSAADVGVEAVAGAGKEEFVDLEGKKRPVKKWLGIW
ncbi:hypothetical protein N7462_003111 [Penicillium macrosclerotiorum]|uniref:uncharacterized protein n=1 Tax=Penicillium macrosclerotiorum TaxID=303699 RepID=UPI002546E13D|nr:uncharacterized protein N7462_003111 [Penicillium macrosclerotiorum]KAJ5688719.1 hypothetical protein N7462_003111 [Penicillium macrosclerotiorum]